MKIHVGCGIRILEGWVNCDIQHHPDAPRAPDILCAAGAIPLPDACADELMAVHLWEHLYRWECEPVIAEWRRLLRHGGKLVLELPDLLKCCQNLVDGRAGKHPDQLSMWGIYGDDRLQDPHMVHKWGWTPSTLEAFLMANGFGKVRHLPTVFHAAGRLLRDMRIEAIKT